MNCLCRVQQKRGEAQRRVGILPAPLVRQHKRWKQSSIGFADRDRQDACPTLTLVVILLFALAAPLFAQRPAVDPAERDRVRFCAVDVYVDATNAPLAAYQLEFAVTNAAAKIVGIEGGEAPAFREAPFYDPKAMQQERAILAAFSLESPDKLPTGKTRVATIHLQVSGTVPLAIGIKLVTAADANGNKIAGVASA